MKEPAHFIHPRIASGKRHYAQWEDDHLLELALMLQKQGKLRDKDNLVRVKLKRKELEVDIPTYVVMRGDPGRNYVFHRNPKLLDSDDWRSAVSDALELYDKHGGKEHDEVLFNVSAPLEEYFRKHHERKRFEEAIHEIGVRPGHHVLDLCAGTGVVTSLLASKVGGKGSVTAIEKHDEPLERARKNNAGNSNVTLLRGNVDVYAGPHKEGGHFKGGLLEIITACEPLPKEAMGRKYDHVTLFDAISYLSPVTEMIALPVVVSSMLKPGGRFTYSTLLGKGEKETQRVWDALRHAGLDHERTVRKGANHFYVFKRASDEEAQKRLEKRYAA